MGSLGGCFQVHKKAFTNLILVTEFFFVLAVGESIRPQHLSQKSAKQKVKL